MNNISYTKAIKLVLMALNINAADAHDFDFAQEDNLLYLSFYTDWQWYECYIDVDSGELCGVNIEPSTNMSYNNGLEDMLSASELISIGA